MAGPLAVGDKPSDFTLPSHLDEDVTLSGYWGPAGKNVVVFFYPLDWTPV
jgi:peroxiredoxin